MNGKFVPMKRSCQYQVIITRETRRRLTVDTCVTNGRSSTSGGGSSTSGGIRRTTVGKVTLVDQTTCLVDDVQRVIVRYVHPTQFTLMCIQIKVKSG